MTTAEVQAQPITSLLNNFSLEMNARDIEKLEKAAEIIPQGTVISVTYLPAEDNPSRIKAAGVVKRLGFIPAPHISARRVTSTAELERFLDGLAQEAGIDRCFCIAGDPPKPEGPYEDALAVIRSGLLQKYGVKRVGISGYPEGHPDIDNAKLRQAMLDKKQTLGDMGMDYWIMTQFGFDAEPMLDWLKQIRADGVQAPVHLGVAGPASVKSLLAFAARCGVGTSAKVMSKYGLSLTKLLTPVGPDPIIRDLAQGVDPAVHGTVRLHFYPFGGLVKTNEWIRDFKAANAGR